jgi:hypothetical protein
MYDVGLVWALKKYPRLREIVVTTTATLGTLHEVLLHLRSALATADTAVNTLYLGLVRVLHDASDDT